MNELLSLDDAKDALKITTSSQDAQIGEYIAAATDLIEAQVGAIIDRTVTRQVRASGGVLRLPIFPVKSLTSVAAALDGGLTYDVDDLTVGPQGVVRLTNRAPILPDLYDVTWDVGIDDAPPRMVQAARVLLAHLWATQRGPSAPGLNRAVDEYDPTATYTMPHRVVELLQWDVTGPLVG